MRRMINPEVIIKSKILDDHNFVDLNEVIDKYGTVIGDDWTDKTITLQIYNKYAGDDNRNEISNDNTSFGVVVINGTITITKYSDGLIAIQGMIFDWENDLIQYIECASGSYENGIPLTSPYDFDIYVIRV